MKNRNLKHKDHWATPPEHYKRWDAEFNFDFDPCPLYHDITEWDGLEIEWGWRNYVNPPYSLKLKEAFVRKALEESSKGKLCVLLLPVSTSTVLFHKVIKPNAADIRFIERRIPFIGVNEKGQCINHHLIRQIGSYEFISHKGSLIPKHIRNSGQHDSMLVIFGNYNDLL
jgi:hypothetical protein